jgi:hypothetical protein
MLLANKLKKFENSRIEQIVATAISNKDIYNGFEKVVPHKMIYQMLILQRITSKC